MADISDVDFSWHSTSQGKDLISSLRHPFGILEKPLALQNASYDVIEYKLLLYGKSGVGKTSLISKLLNIRSSSKCYETPGIEVSSIYWPIKRMNSGVVTMFKLSLWDIGDNALLRHAHLTGSCREGLDGIIFVFSFTDKSSFTDVARKVVLEESGLCKFIVGCKLDSADIEVTVKEVQEFEEFWKDRVFTSPSTIGDVADLLNNICFQLVKQNRKPPCGGNSCGGLADCNWRETEGAVIII